MTACNISFSLTAGQIKARQKTVTRRFGWWNLQPGTVLTGIGEVGNGDKAEKICLIRIVSVRPEPLRFMLEDRLYGQRECELEGFPDMSPEEYVSMRLKKHGVITDKICNRIYFEYLDEEVGNEIKKSITQKAKKTTG